MLHYRYDYGYSCHCEGLLSPSAPVAHKIFTDSYSAAYVRKPNSPAVKTAVRRHIDDRTMKPVSRVYTSALYGT